jgi:predicted membrane-bound mannosyltransferase
MTTAGTDLRIFLGFYALIMLLVCSAIPYKTPWLVLGALQPFAIMAGCGLSALLRRLEARRLRPLGFAVAGLLVSHLAWQAWLASFRYYDDPVNPLVYAHPTDDVRKIAATVTRAVRAGAASVQVICGGHDYWPMPWYLRSLPRVGWWSGVGEGFVPSPVILASPACESVLVQRLYETPLPGERMLYVPLFEKPMFLRPGIEMRGYVTLDIRNAMQNEMSP